MVNIDIFNKVKNKQESKVPNLPFFIWCRLKMVTFENQVRLVCMEIKDKIQGKYFFSLQNSPLVTEFHVEFSRKLFLSMQKILMT